MNYVLGSFLIIICVKVIQADIFSYQSCNGTSEYSASPHCYICASAEECRNATKKVCTAADVQETLANLKKVFHNSKSLTDKYQHHRLVCFSMQAHDLNGKEYDVRGCMYYQLPKIDHYILEYSFDFMRFYKKRVWHYNVTELESYAPNEGWLKGYIRKTRIIIKKQLKKTVEDYDRQYWNTTHFPDISCTQCEGEVCNRLISPYEGGRILFQRPFHCLKQWNCIKYSEINKEAFSEKCHKDTTIGGEDSWESDEKNLKCGDEWDWPNNVYVPPRKPFGGWYP